MSLRDDVILRVIHQLVEALLKAAGLRKKKDLPAAEDALGAGLEALGIPLNLLRSVPTATLLNLVPDPIRRALVSASLVELALIAAAKGDDATADALDDRAVELMEHVDATKLPLEVIEALPVDMRPPPREDAEGAAADPPVDVRE